MLLLVNDLNTSRPEAVLYAHEAASRAQLQAVAMPTPVTETGMTRTLTAADNGKLIVCTNANGCTLTVADNLPAGFSCLAMVGHVTGSVVWAPGAFNAIHNVNGFTTCSFQYGVSGVLIYDNQASGVLTGSLDV